MSQDAAAIIVAGGQGKRFGGRIRKQYLTLSRKPILWWSVQAFLKSPSIGALVLVVPANDLPRIRRQFGGRSRKSLHVVAGGATRADSVGNGLRVVPAGFKWVAVHDAVRPLVSSALIEDVLKAARSHRGAIAACPSQDTVKIASSSQTIQKTIPRHQVWLAQTPQAFERKLLERAHGLTAGRSRRGTVPKFDVTDDAQLVERLGVRVKLVASSSDNLKVTLPRDFQMAQWLIKQKGHRS